MWLAKRLAWHLAKWLACHLAKGLAKWLALQKLMIWGKRKKRFSILHIMRNGMCIRKVSKGEASKAGILSL